MMSDCSLGFLHVLFCAGHRDRYIEKGPLENSGYCACALFWEQARESKKGVLDSSIYRGGCSM